jgi:hypothetical protein
MRKLLFASAAISALTIGLAQAQETPAPPPGAPAAERAADMDDETTQSTNPNADAGAIGGGVAGAATGAVIGGPVGAVIGGFAGAMLGTAAAVSEPAVEYVVANPVEPVMIEGGVSEGMVIPGDVVLTPIPEDPAHAYVYVDGRPVIVRAETREVVYSPGYVVSEPTVAYVESNPVDPAGIEVMTVGEVVPDTVQLVEVPNDPAYAYVYTDNGPMLVNRSSRTVVWVRGG